MGIVREITPSEANSYYCQLPLGNQIGTLSPQYILADAKRDSALTPVFLIYQEYNKFWLIGMHKMHIPGSDYFALSSPYPYGGPNTNTEDLDFLGRAWESYRKWSWQNMVLCEIVKLHPLLKHPYYGECKTDRITYTCGLEYEPKCRNMVSKAKRNNLTMLQLNNSVIGQHFGVDYREAMEDMGADQFYHFNDEYFDALSNIEDACLLIAEDEGGSWVSAAIFIAGGLSMEYHLSITRPRGRELGSANMIIDGARQSLDARCDLYLGGGKTSSPDDSLARFKKGFGGKQLPFNIGWQIHRPDVYREMRGNNTSERVLFWK